MYVYLTKKIIYYYYYRNIVPKLFGNEIIIKKIKILRKKHILHKKIKSTKEKEIYKEKTKYKYKSLKKFYCSFCFKFISFLQCCIFSSFFVF